MLGILLLYFIGKYHYTLADKYEKSKWGYAILGIITYYAGTIIYSLAYYYFIFPEALETTTYGTDWTLTFTAIPFGIGATYGLYYLLEKNWKREEKKDQVSIEDIGKES